MRDAPLLRLEVQAGLGDDVLEAGRRLLRLKQPMLAHRVRLGAGVDHDGQQRRPRLLEVRLDDHLRGGQAGPQVEQLAVASNAPGIQAFECLSLAHAGRKAGAQVRRSNARVDGQTDCRIGG